MKRHQWKGKNMRKIKQYNFRISDHFNDKFTTKTKLDEIFESIYPTALSNLFI